MRKYPVWSLILILFLVTACSGGANSISAVTPLPTQTPTTAISEATAISEQPSASPEATATVPPSATPEPTATVTATAISLLEQTAAAATQVTVTPFVSAAESTAAPNQSSAGSGSRFPTPVPYTFAGLAPGEARDIARATDQVMQPTPQQTVTFEEEPVTITFSEFYSGFDIRRGLLMTDKLVSLDGREVVMEGYVAPPLKPRLDFFVLTRIPLAFCPFCSSDVEWPDDIALVYLPEQQIISSEFPVRIRGRMEIGVSVDAETGMVSLVRIYADELEVMN